MCRMNGTPCSWEINDATVFTPSPGVQFINTFMRTIAPVIKQNNDVQPIPAITIRGTSLSSVKDPAIKAKASENNMNATDIIYLVLVGFGKSTSRKMLSASSFVPPNLQRAA